MQELIVLVLGYVLCGCVILGSLGSLFYMRIFERRDYKNWFVLYEFLSKAPTYANVIYQEDDSVFKGSVWYEFEQYTLVVTKQSKIWAYDNLNHENLFTEIAYGLIDKLVYKNICKRVLRLIEVIENKKRDK
jgi:hypothetical protein